MRRFARWLQAAYCAHALKGLYRLGEWGPFQVAAFSAMKHGIVLSALPAEFMQRWKKKTLWPS